MIRIRAIDRIGWRQLKSSAHLATSLYL